MASAAFAQVGSLSFRPIDAEYSSALDRIIFVSASPDQLHIYDAVTNFDQVVNLPKPPTSVSVSPNGLFAAVGHDALISYVNLSNRSIEKSLPVPVAVSDLVLASQYVHVLPSASVNLSTGAVSSGSGSSYGGSGAALHPSGTAIYSTRDGTSPNDILRFDVSTGPITTSSDSPYHGDYPACGTVWFSRDGTRIYNGCGTVYGYSGVAAEDMRYRTMFYPQIQIQSLSESSARQSIAIIPKGYYYTSSADNPDTEIRTFHRDYLLQTGRYPLPGFWAGGRSYPGHGKWLFFSSDSSWLFVVMQADASSGLMNDYAVYRIQLAHPLPCSPSFSTSTASVPARGGPHSVDIQAPVDCLYTAVSSVPWISLVSPPNATGNMSLSYAVRANPAASPRSGTITVGSQTLTVSQEAAPAFTPGHTRLAFKVVDAEYSKALDRLVMVSADPNELILFDPETGAQQYVPLPREPMSVSVRPDGLYAAVGHRGWVSLVNLQSALVDRVVAAPTNVQDVVLAGNGYLYANPGSDQWTELQSLNLNTNVWSATSSVYSGSTLRLHPLGKYLYNVDTWTTKFDISQGVPTLVRNFTYDIATSRYLWFSESGDRFLTDAAKMYRSSEVAAQDGQYNGALSAATGARWAAHSAVQQSFAVIPGSYYGQSEADKEAQIYGDAFLGFAGRLPFSKFDVAGTQYAAHGRFLFWNRASSKLVAATEADTAANLSADAAVQVISSSGSSGGCTYSIDPGSTSISANGGYGSVTVTSGPACVWQSSSPVPWATIASGQVGFGSSTVYYSVAPSTLNDPRVANLSIAGRTFTLTQTPITAIMSVAPTAVTFPATSGSFSFTVTCPSPACTWTAASSTPWATISSGTSGTGSGTVVISYAANIGTTLRSGSLIIAGQTVNIAQSPPVGLLFMPVTPCRIVDTRNPTGPFGGPRLAGNSIRSFAIPQGACGIPSSALAYSLNVTVVPRAALAYLTLWPTGQPQPYVSTLNSYAGDVVANAAIVPAGDGGAVSVYVTGDTEVILDINGYFQSSAGSFFFADTPCRVADTRTGTLPFGGGSYSAGESRSYPVPSSPCGIPSNATAYAMNVTTVPPSPLSFLSLWPTGLTRPMVSTLNSWNAKVVANAALAPAGTNGAVSVYASDRTDVILDINGHFGVSSGANSLRFYKVTPCRVADTRNPDGAFGGPMLPASGTRSFLVPQSSCGIPPTAKAYSVNVTVVPSASLYYLTAWPAAAARPNVSTLNSWDGAILANAAIIPAGANGAISFYVTDSTHLILDINGYFQ